MFSLFTYLILSLLLLWHGQDDDAPKTVSCIILWYEGRFSGGRRGLEPLQGDVYCNWHHHCQIKHQQQQQQQHQFLYALHPIVSSSGSIHAIVVGVFIVINRHNINYGIIMSRWSGNCSDDRGRVDGGGFAKGKCWGWFWCQNQVQVLDIFFPTVCVVKLFSLRICIDQKKW